MTSAHDNRRDHILRQPLEKTVAKAIANNAETAQIVEEILAELDEQNLIYYKPRNSVNLFTPAGRILVMLLDRPGLTVREMSVTLGCSLAAVTQAIALLTKDGLIQRNRQNGRYEYRINAQHAVEHQDLRRLVKVITTAIHSDNTPG